MLQWLAFESNSKNKSLHWFAQPYVTGPLARITFCGSPHSLLIMSQHLSLSTLVFTLGTYNIYYNTSYEPDAVVIVLHILSNSIPIIISPILQMIKQSYKEVN